MDICNTPIARDKDSTFIRTVHETMLLEMLVPGPERSAWASRIVMCINCMCGRDPEALIGYEKAANAMEETITRLVKLHSSGGTVARDTLENARLKFLRARQKYYSVSPKITADQVIDAFHLAALELDTMKRGRETGEAMRLRDAYVEQEKKEESVESTDSKD